MRKHSREAGVLVSNGQFEVAADSRFLAYAEQNGWTKRLDISVRPRVDVAASQAALLVCRVLVLSWSLPGHQVAPYGLIRYAQVMA